MNSLMFADGTSVSRLQQLFVTSFARLRADQWQWDTVVETTPRGARYVMSAWNETTTHAVVADDVETMLQAVMGSVYGQSDGEVAAPAAAVARVGRLVRRTAAL